MPAREPYILNFAYGSNMLRARLLARTPGAVKVGTATLIGHELRWHKRGQDGSGKCDVVVSRVPGACVHGVVWQIPHAEKPWLDAAEGLGEGYDEDRVEVVLADSLVACRVYRATLIEPGLRPFEWYRALVTAGAREQGLPEDYIDRLQAVDAQFDEDRDRYARHWALLSQVA